MSTNALPHSAEVLIKSPDQLMLTNVEDVKTANGQDIFQTTRELNAFWDHLLNAIASANNLKIDTLAKNAHTAKDKTQETHNNVSKHQDVTKETKSLDSEMLKTAITAEPVLSHKFQERTDQSATDQDQLAHVLRDTLLMVTAASHALMDKSLMTQEMLATQPHNASV